MKMPQLERGQPEAWPDEPARGWGLGTQAGEGSRAKAQGMPPPGSTGYPAMHVSLLASAPLQMPLSRGMSCFRVCG